MSLKVQDLTTLYVAQLKDAYSAETQLTKALPTMIEKAKSDTLRTALESHLKETETHRERIEQIFKGLAYQPGGEKCAAMAGLIEEAEELVGDHVSEPEAVDAAIICASNKVEHYEIATYGTLRKYAEMLGRSDDAGLLASTLEEEKAADEKLTEIAISSANRVAAV